MDTLNIAMTIAMIAVFIFLAVDSTSSGNDESTEY